MISMSADDFDSLLDAVEKVLSVLKRHRRATISKEDFKAALEETLAAWAAVKPRLDSSDELEAMFQSATKTAESTRPTVKLLRSKFAKIRKNVRDSKLSFLSTGLPPRYSELKKRTVGIRSGVCRGFLEEAFRCWINKTRRAAVVTAWCAVEARLFDVYRTTWSIDQIKSFIPEAKRHFIKIHDDLTYLSDDALLTGLRDNSVLGSAEYRLLGKVCKTYRDLAAHASLKRDIHDDEVSANLQIVLDFLSRPI